MHKELAALAHRGGLWTRPSLRRAGFTESMISEALRTHLLTAHVNGTFEVAPKRFRVMESEQMTPGDTVMRVVNGELKQFQVVGEPNGGRVSLVDPEDPNARVQQVNQSDTAEPVPGSPGVPLEPGQPVPPAGTVPAIRPQTESRLRALLESGKPWEKEEEEEPEGGDPKPPVTESEAPVGEPPAAGDIPGVLAQRMAAAYKDWEAGRSASPSASDWVKVLGELVNKPDIMRYGGEDLSDFVYDLLSDGSTIKRAARLLFRRYQHQHPQMESKTLAERLLENDGLPQASTPVTGGGLPLNFAVEGADDFYYSFEDPNVTVLGVNSPEEFIAGLDQWPFLKWNFTNGTLEFTNDDGSEGEDFENVSYVDCGFMMSADQMHAEFDDLDESKSLAEHLLENDGTPPPAPVVQPDVGVQLAKWFDDSAYQQGIDIEEMGWGLDTDEQIQAVRDGTAGKPLTPEQTASLIKAAKDMAFSSGCSVEEMTGISGLDDEEEEDTHGPAAPDSSWVRVSDLGNSVQEVRSALSTMGEFLKFQAGASDPNSKWTLADTFDRRSLFIKNQHGSTIRIDIDGSDSDIRVRRAQ